MLLLVEAAFGGLGTGCAIVSTTTLFEEGFVDLAFAVTTVTVSLCFHKKQC